MDSLSSGPITAILQRLHQEADAADAPMMPAFESKGTTVEQAIDQIIEEETEDLTGCRSHTKICSADFRTIPHFRSGPSKNHTTRLQNNCIC
jgi:hypothetical protein